jgi:6-phosphogluconolactonase
LLSGDFAYRRVPLHHDMAHLPLFIGTYTRQSSRGIYSLQLDLSTGALSEPQLAAETPSPSYLALSPDNSALYAVSEADAMAAAFRVEPDKKSLFPIATPQKAGGKAPCHLVVDATGRTLLVANYHTGVVASLPILPGGGLGAAGSIIQHQGSSIDPERQSSPHAHCVVLSPDNRFVFVCDLGVDKIFSYRLDPARATLSPTEIPFTPTTPGTGPRHLAFSPDGRHAFVISEMGALLTAYRYDIKRGTLHPTDAQSSLPKNHKGENKSAAVRVHPKGRFVYASNRGPDDIAVFAFDPTAATLSLLENIPSGGQGPRDFALTPDGRWLVSANQDSDLLQVFAVSPENGRLTRANGTARISMPVCVLFADS